MISTQVTLHAIQSYLEKQMIKDKIKLYKSPPLDKQGIERPEKVMPVITTGGLPHTNFSLYGAGNEFFQAPYVLVGYEDGSLQAEEQQVGVLIHVCCYSQGLYIEDQQSQEYEMMIPDNKAYEDCVWLLEWIQSKLLEINALNGATIEFPIRMGTYNTKELTYPYSFGYVSFDMKSNGYVRDRKNYKY